MLRFKKSFLSEFHLRKLLIIYMRVACGWLAVAIADRRMLLINNRQLQKQLIFEVQVFPVNS